MEEETVYVPLNKLKIVHPLFRKFSVEAVSAILQLGNIILLKPDQVLFRKGDEELKFYVIIFGWMNIVKKTEEVVRGGSNIRTHRASNVQLAPLTSKGYQLMGSFGAGTTVGEEWLF